MEKKVRKIGIVTIIDNTNYGNRLQNYALQKFLSGYSCVTETLINETRFNNKKNYYLGYLKSIIKNTINHFNKDEECSLMRVNNFNEFNKNITFCKKKLNPFYYKYEMDYFVVGSDQVWNPMFGRLSDVDLLTFATSNKKISFSASFGIEKLPMAYHEKVKKELNTFKAISVREDAGKKIIENLTSRNDVEVLVDPTMLLNANEWDKVAKKPKMLKSKKYILNYFLGSLSNERQKEIERVAKENECIIINILDKNDPFYICGPSEFLYLEKHAFLICTDSFHSSVFAVIFNRPFIVFDRDEKNVVSMGSRLDTLISKLNLKNRKYNGKNITKENINHDYSEAYKQLDIEKERAISFLKKAILGNLNEN